MVARAYLHPKICCRWPRSQFGSRHSLDSSEPWLWVLSLLGPQCRGSLKRSCCRHLSCAGCIEGNEMGSEDDAPSRRAAAWLGTRRVMCSRSRGAHLRSVSCYARCDSGRSRNNEEQAPVAKLWMRFSYRLALAPGRWSPPRGDVAGAHFGAVEGMEWRHRACRGSSRS